MDMTKPLQVLYPCSFTWDLDSPWNAHSWTFPHLGIHVLLSSSITIIFFQHHNLILIKIPSLEGLPIASILMFLIPKVHTRWCTSQEDCSRWNFYMEGTLHIPTVRGTCHLNPKLWWDTAPGSSFPLPLVSKDKIYLFPPFLSVILLSPVPCCDNAMLI